MHIKKEEIKKIKNEFFENNKKAAIFGAFGAAIGGCIGGYVSFIKGNYIYAGLGAGIGVVMGNLIGLLLGKRISLEKLLTIKKNIFKLFGIFCILLSAAGLIGFFLTKKWIGIIGAIFFALCGILFYYKNTIDSH